MATVYFGLGSNVGDPESHLQYGLRELAARVGPITKVSSTYVTAPYDAPEQPDFHNRVAECETDLPPEEVLTSALAIERARGRTRDQVRGPRTLDIDLLLYAGEERETQWLELPHPRMEERAFVIVPLAEIAPDLILPSGRIARERAEDPDIQNQRVQKQPNGIFSI
jgi:2-amino-4-hydroxy-6-hydroxymethyldihydropteridine diphosphokinase